MKNLLVILIILLVAVGCSDNANSQVSLVETDIIASEGNKIQYPKWLTLLYPDSIINNEWIQYQSIVKFIELNDSISYCIYESIGGVCSNTYLATHKYNKKLQSIVIAENCDHDLSIPNYSWKEYKLKDDYIIEITEFIQSVPIEFLNEEGQFNDGETFEDFELLEYKYYSSIEITETGEILDLNKESNIVSNKNFNIQLIAWDSIEVNEKEILKECWGNFKTQLRNKNIDSTLSLMSFPLTGEWGFVLGLKKEGELLTKEHFKVGFNQIFTKSVITQLLNQNIEQLDIIYNLDSKHVDGFRIGTDIGDDEFEANRFFNFCKIGNTYKLCHIWHAG
ncbi:MAG: hypothetical protein H6586_01570 [Flavobacteriales bacterium]|nr:hypothetical protein [Flavobacteriales bacterium]